MHNVTPAFRRDRGERPIVRAESVGIRLGPRWVLERVSLDVRAGEITTLVGNNGSGKTTLLLALLGLLAPHQGTIQRDRRLRVGYVPQQFQADPNLPITVRRFLRLAAAEGSPQWREAVADTGVEGLLEAPMQGVSGGEMRRVLLARALLQRPSLLALDEPAAGLDGRSQGELYALIRRIRDRQGCAVVVVSHDLNLVMAASDQVLCLGEGRVLCCGEPATVVQHPEYRALFGAHLGPETAVFAHNACQHEHPSHEDADARRRGAADG